MASLDYTVASSSLLLHSGCQIATARPVCRHIDQSYRLESMSVPCKWIMRESGDGDAQVVHSGVPSTGVHFVSHAGIKPMYVCMYCTSAVTLHDACEFCLVWHLLRKSAAARLLNDNTRRIGSPACHLIYAWYDGVSRLLLTNPRLVAESQTQNTMFTFSYPIHPHPASQCNCVFTIRNRPCHARAPTYA